MEFIHVVQPQLALMRRQCKSEIHDGVMDSAVPAIFGILLLPAAQCLLTQPPHELRLELALPTNHDLVEVRF